MLHQLIYISYATELFGPYELVEILNKSRINNARLGVTGLLLYHEGSIIQVLEGENEVVHALYKKICKDSRHGGIIILIDAGIDWRSFPDWSMGFRPISADNLSHLQGYLKLDNRHQVAQVSTSISSEVITLINSFANVNIERYGQMREDNL